MSETRVENSTRKGQLAREETLILDGLTLLPTGWAMASDPNVVKLDDRWLMFFTSIRLGKEMSLHILAAFLPMGSDLSADPSKWTIFKKDGKVSPIISPGEKGAWDEKAVETAKYVRGYDRTARSWVERIYYTGWRSTPNNLCDYRIGYVQRNGSDWVKHDGPVLTGTSAWQTLNGHSFIGDQSVFYEPGTGPNGEDGTWHIWYNANSEKGVFIGYANSYNGISWTNQQRLAHVSPHHNKVVPSGPYHLDMIRMDGRYVFSGWISAEDISQQGLWMVSSFTPTGTAKSDFFDWRPLIYEDNGVSWHYAGKTGSAHHTTGLFSATLVPDNGKLWLFYHGVRRTAKVSDPYDASKNVASIGRALVSRK